MKYKKTIAALAGAAVLSLALVGCGGGGSAAPQESSDEPVPAIEQLAGASGAVAHLDEANQQAEIDVTIADGEALVIMANFESNDGEATAITYKDGEEYTTDTFYEGSAYSEMSADPGTYTVKFDGAGATGTVWALAYPADTVDVMNMDTDDIIAQVLADVE